jgi:tetratricopeptide (TPR) repeat protein
VSLKASLLFLLPVVALLFVGCSGSKAYYKKAQKLQEAGLTDEAAEFFYEAVRRNPSNVDARIALKASGQKLLDKKLEKFYKAHGAANHGEAVYAYQDATAYRKKIATFLELEQPPYYESSYRESRDKYLEQRYAEATKLMEEEKFAPANEILNEIIKLDPNYENAGKLRQKSSAEPLYREGLELYEARNYRSAYQKFKNVLDIDPGYKEAPSLLNESLNNARLTVAIMPVESGSGIEKAAADKFYDVLIAEILKSGNPFITLIDRRNTQQLLEEQKMGLSGIVEQSSAARAGKMLGARVVLSARIISLSEQSQNPAMQQMRGWEEYTERRLNKETGNYYNQTMYRKVQYQMFEGQSSVNLSVSATLISSETGEVLIANTAAKTASDQLQYAQYEGNKSALKPGNWKSLQYNDSSDKIITSGPEKKNLDRLMGENRRTLIPTSQLRLSAMQEAAKAVASELNQFEQSRK